MSFKNIKAILKAKQSESIRELVSSKMVSCYKLEEGAVMQCCKDLFCDSDTMKIVSFKVIYQEE